MRTNRTPVAIPVAIVALILLLAAAVPCAGLEQSRPNILVSNDDGIDAPGLAALVESLRRIGKVTVAAPLKDLSGVSHAMTSNKFISVTESERNGVKWYGIDAFPATCARLALDVLLPEKPDFVVTGVNGGENLGVVTYYSATVAGAREATFLGIPAVSVNLQSGNGMDYTAAADFTAALVKELAGRRLPSGVFLNINLPNLPKDRIRGIMITRQDPRPAAEIYEKREARGAETIYWATYKSLGAGAEGTDLWAQRNGYISITPLLCDQTAAAGLSDLKSLEKMPWR
jgi:5'-nucleotidase